MAIRNLKLTLLGLFAVIMTRAVLAQGTVFTYQGRLNDSGQPANGTYDLTFSLFGTSSGSSPLSGPITNSAVGLSNGLFTVTMDFGANFPGADRWLELGVRTNGGGAFATLSPRQKLTPTPYALTAGNVVAGGMAPGTYGNALSFNNPANSFSGSFAGNGTGLTNINASSLGGLTSSNFWRTSGNTGTTPGPNFIGTADNQPLEVHVNGQRAWRLEPNTNGAPNLTGGSLYNEVDSGIVGATIGGGGATNYFGTAYTNRVSSDFATIGGGSDNIIQNTSVHSVIGGGANNTIQVNCSYSTVGGGSGNSIQGIDAFNSTIGGGYQNTIEPGASVSVIGGGFQNTNGGQYATVPGGFRNYAAGNYSFAAGNQAQALHQGALVWADSQNTPFSSTGNNQFLIRAQGGVGINTSNPNGAALSINGGVLRLNDNHIYFRGGTDQYHGLGWYSSATFAGANPDGPVLFGCGGGALGTACGSQVISLFWTATGVTVNGTFNNNSDRNAKEHFTAISPEEVLDKVATLPITEWSYKTDAATRHLGPTAQDFSAAFNVGTDDKHIAPIDEGGVALAPIQGLNQKLEEELRAKDKHIAELETRLNRLERLMESGVKDK
ncbi:MAG TPA: tail fiber domain-containing protein [Candidatus Acidoferrum sp.]|nr:tail fiber domain-containing protein [Candidatus Acidoferrum sp.]